jgi:hypothetical protein
MTIALHQSVFLSITKHSKQEGLENNKASVLIEFHKTINQQVNNNQHCHVQAPYTSGLCIGVPNHKHVRRVHTRQHLGNVLKTKNKLFRLARDQRRINLQSMLCRMRVPTWKGHLTRG